MPNGSAILVVPAELETGPRIRLARVAAELGVAEMAARLGFSTDTYSRIESGARPVRRGELIAIAQITGQGEEFFGASFDEDEVPNLPLLPGQVNPEGL